MFGVQFSTKSLGPGDGKLFRSVDEGDTWTDISRRLPNWELQVTRNCQEEGYDLVFNGGTIYAGTRDDVFHSTDGGEIWTSIVAGLPDGYIEVQLVAGATLYGTNSHGIFRLTHGSDSWEKIASMQLRYSDFRWMSKPCATSLPIPNRQSLSLQR